MSIISPTSNSLVLTEDEAAELLRVKRYTMRKWRRDGNGPRFIRCGGRLVRYTKNDLNSWLATHNFQSNAHELSVKAPK